MGKNNHAKAIDDWKNTYMMMEQETTRQFIIDLFCEALNDPEVMGKDVLGRKRLKKVLQTVSIRYDYYHKALEKSQEADYYQEKLDEKLQRIFQEDFNPFPERYSWIKMQKY